MLVAARCLLVSVGCGAQTTAAGGVSWEVAEEQAAAAPKGKKKKQKLSVKVPKWCGKWVVGMDDFKEGVVGAKSKNIAGAATAREGGHYCLHSDDVLAEASMYSLYSSL